MAFIPGSEDNDPLDGTEGADTILGFGGSDTINGLGGNDLINPGSAPSNGQDRIFGSTGNDQIVFSDVQAGGGYLQLSYVDLSRITATINGPGNTGSIVKGTSGINGTDTLTDIATALASVNFELWGTAGRDTFTVSGGVNSFVVLAGSEGNDTFNLTLTGEIALIYDGSWFDFATAGVVLNLTTGVVANDGFGFTDTLNISNTPTDD